MKRRGKHSAPRNLIDDLRKKQSNITWPDAQINSRGVDAFLWRGNPKAPLVQRVGAMLFGLMFFGLGGAFYSLSRSQDGLDFWIPCLFSWALFALGARFCYNALRRK